MECPEPAGFNGHRSSSSRGHPGKISLIPKILILFNYMPFYTRAQNLLNLTKLDNLSFVIDPASRDGSRGVGSSTLSTGWSALEAQSEWPHCINKSAQAHIYQIEALEQLTKVTTVHIRHFGLQKKYGTKHVFWDSSGSIGKYARS